MSDHDDLHLDAPPHGRLAHEGLPYEELTLRRLTSDRAEAVARLAELEQQHAGVVEASALTNADDEHDPEGSTIAFDRAQLAAVIDQTRRQLDDLDRALTQLEAGQYGRCEICGEPIGAERLEARPSARTCIRCASAGRGRLSP